MIFNSINFDYPFILIALTILIPLTIIDIISRKKRVKLKDELEKKLLTSVFFFRLFLAFAIIALAGPRWGTEYAPTEYRRGIDVIFAIDVSRSMDIRDMQINSLSQSRLERGLVIAKETIASIPGARFAAAIGRGRGYLAVPLTFDNEAAFIFLETLDGSSMTGRSTNLESLIEAACNAFQSTSPARKVIVLISDGESHAGILRNAVNYCAREGIIINTIAVGSDEGQRIPAQANNLDAPMVISRRDIIVMRSTAERTGGIYIDGARQDASFALSSHLLSLAREIQPGFSSPEPKLRRTLFIILALISYCASKFMTRQSRRLTSIIALALLVSSCTEGKLLLLEANYLHSRNRYDEAIITFQKALNHEDAAPYAEYGLGLTLYLLDQGETSLKRYGDSQKLLEAFSGNEHRELRYRNHYNSGIIHFENDDYISAAAAFKEALRIDPRRIDAKRNLELSLLSITIESKTENRTDNDRHEEIEVIFDFIREEEQQLWRSRQWAPEENQSGPDY